MERLIRTEVHSIQRQKAYLSLYSALNGLLKSNDLPPEVSIRLYRILENHRGAFAEQALGQAEADRFKGSSIPGPIKPAAPASAASSAPTANNAAAVSSSLLSVTREIEAVERMREALGERQFQGLLRQLTPTLQIGRLEESITKEKEKQLQQLNAGPISETAQLEAMNRLLDLEDQLVAAHDRRAEAAAAAAEEERQANEKLISQQQSLADILAQTEILRAQAAGNDEKAAALQREADIQATVKNILDATNLSEQEALKLAREQQDLKDQIANQGQGKDTSGRIDASIEPGGADAARQRAEQRVQDAKDRVNNKGISGQFAEEDAAQKARFAKQFGPPGADQRQNPAALDAAKNQQAANAGQAGGTDQLAQQALQVMNQMLSLMQ
jgi:hypothetical protein